MSDKDLRIATLKSEIINRVIAIETRKADKAAQMKSYNGVIKSLENERKTLLRELSDLQKLELTEDADDLLEKSGDKKLTSKNMN